LSGGLLAVPVRMKGDLSYSQAGRERRMETLSRLTRMT